MAAMQAGETSPGPEVRHRFWQAEPYPHVALDGFFTADFFARLSESMRRISDAAGASHTYNTDIERNKQCFAEDAFDDNIRNAAHYLSGPAFLGYLESLLEVKGLIPLTAVKSLSSRSYFHVSSGGG